MNRRDTDPTRPLVIHDGNGGWLVLGIGLLVAGSVLLARVGRVDVEVGLCWGLGLACLATRRSAVLDRSRGTLGRRLAGFPWVAYRTTELGAPERVELRREQRDLGTPEGQPRRVVTYPVGLRGPSGRLEVTSRSGLVAARRVAERVAKYLRLPLLDATTLNPVLRPVEDLDVPLRERLAAAGDDPEAPGSGPPEGSAIELLDAAPGALLAVELPRGWQRERVTVTHDTLSVERRALVPLVRKRFPLDELEELELAVPVGSDGAPGAPAIQIAALLGRAGLFRLFRKPTLVARSDRAQVAFGSGLEVSDALWLRAALLHAIRGG